MESSAPFVREGQTSVLFAPQGDAPPEPSIDEMSEVFLHWPRCIGQCTDFLPHVEAAIGNAEWRKARRTGQAAFAFLRSHERLFEATHIARVLLRRAEGQGDMDSAGWAREEISWIAGGERVRAASPPREQLSLLFHLIAKSELYSCPMWPACSR